MSDNFKLFAGTANPQLVRAVQHELGIDLGKCEIENARYNLNHHSIEGIFVTDTVAIEQSSSLQVQLVSVAPLIVHAIKKMLTDSN